MLAPGPRSGLRCSRERAADGPGLMKIAGMGIALQLLLNRQSQALHAPAHVRVPGRDPDPDATRNRDHCRARMASTRASAATSTPASTMTRRSFPISISMRPLAGTAGTDRRRIRHDHRPREAGFLPLSAIPLRTERSSPIQQQRSRDAVPSRGRRDRPWRLHALQNDLELLVIRPARKHPVRAACRSVSAQAA